MNKEFICIEETIADTQKKIRTWISSNYKIEIIAQNIMPIGVYEGYLVTSLWRWKSE